MRVFSLKNQIKSCCRKIEEEGNKKQRSRREAERRLWDKERNKIEIIVLGKANIISSE